MINSASPKHERDLLRVMIAGTAISFGFMAALLQTLRVDANGWVFALSGGTVLAFLAGAGLTVGVWRLALRQQGRRGGRFARLLPPLVLLTGVAAFLYPLRFVAAERLPDIGVGLVLATGALSFVGWMLWRVGSYLEQDARQNAETGADGRPPNGN